jgi:hypothetical protein
MYPWEADPEVGTEQTPHFAYVLGERPDPRWAQVAAKLFIPFSAAERRHLDFDPSVPRDPREGSTLDLLMYPSLDEPMAPQIRRNDYDHTMIAVRDGHVQPHGMGLAPASIAAATVGDAESAIAWLQSNFTSNLIKPPFNVRTETPTNNTGYFVTASGAYLQNLIYGFSGLRIQPKGLVAAYAPVLPSEWKSLTLRHLSFRGQLFDIVIERNDVGRVRLRRRRV